MPSLDTVRSQLKAGGISQGGFVMGAPSGIWQNAFELDNSMEYPSVIITCNADISTKSIQRTIQTVIHSCGNNASGDCVSPRH